MDLKDRLRAVMPVAGLEAVAVPEWGEHVTVYVRSMTLAAADEFERMVVAADAEIRSREKEISGSMPILSRAAASRGFDLMAHQIAHGVCDANGAPLFTREEAGDIRPLDVAARLSRAVNARTYGSPPAPGKPVADPVADAEKNSGPTPAAGSG